MKPKLWQGPTAIGQAHSRALNNLPSRVGTSYGVETLDNGHLGTTMSKKCGDYNEVYRYGGSTDPTYFLCTWPQTVVTTLNQTTHRKDVRFVEIFSRSYAGTGAAGWTTKPAGGCQYVGAGFVAGVKDIAQAPAGYTTPGAIFLMRVPVPGKLITASEHIERFGEGAGGRSGYSVEIELPEEFSAAGYGQHFFNPHIVPLGWKNEKEGYVFAVVDDIAYSSGPLGEIPIVVVSTKTFKVSVKTLSLPGGATYAERITDITCTGPGRMEFILTIAQAGPADTATWGTMTMFRSDDYGASWTNSTLDDGWHYSNLPNESIYRAHPGGGVIVGAGNTTFIAVQIPVSGRYLWNFGFILALFARTGDGAFARKAWPGDDIKNPPPNADIRVPVSTQLSMQLLLPLMQISDDSTPMVWQSVGEGCAAFFLFPKAGVSDNEKITVLATADAGETWNTRVIENSANMSQVCLLASDTREPGSFLFAVIDPSTYVTQIYRMSADLSKLDKYGPPYPDPWRRGLINFKDYVHPGFPGVYDGPEHQPRTPA